MWEDDIFHYLYHCIYFFNIIRTQKNNRIITTGSLKNVCSENMKLLVLITKIFFTLIHLCIQVQILPEIKGGVGPIFTHITANILNLKYNQHKIG